VRACIFCCVVVVVVVVLERSFDLSLLFLEDFIKTKKKYKRGKFQLFISSDYLSILIKCILIK
jgi:predicted metal-binding transcription factor (methanogenesis marker protein 9)